jgi:hypothetical protein
LKLPPCDFQLETWDSLEERPDGLLILPWNIADEVSEQLSDLAVQGTRFVTAVPELRKRSWGDAACA